MITPTRMRTFLAIILALLLLTPAAGAVGGNGNAILGLWEVEDGSGRIEILRCGEKYCGRIAWLKEPNYPADDRGGMGGKPLLDRENPSRELRDRPQMGLRIMEGYTFRGDNRWDGGTIYNTENGKSYKSSLSLLSPDRLKLRAFIGISLLGGSTVWKRVASQK
ncbi:MAG TPA: DUF2147 domain-containing protein [Geobacteraceae bacterium]|nr:DUF2147 domain-containing protein [Geobacteraceae bacterium]